MKPAGTLAIQSGGRLKPFDTFSREAMQLFTGRETFRKKSAVELMFSLSFEPQLWHEFPFLQVSLSTLKKYLGLNKKQDRFSPKEIMHSGRLMPLFQEMEA